MSISDESEDKPKQPTTTFGHRVGETVYKLRTKIMTYWYVKFRSDTDEYHLTMKHRATSFVKNRPVRNLTIFQWMEVFDIFTSIYISSAPTMSKNVKLTADLLTFQSNILSYHQQSYNWQDLDRHFRQEQEVKPIAWSQFVKTSFSYITNQLRAHQIFASNPLPNNFNKNKFEKPMENPYQWSFAPPFTPPAKCALQVKAANTNTF